MNSRFRRFLLQSVAWRTFAPTVPQIIYAAPGERLLRVMAAGAGDPMGVA